MFGSWQRQKMVEETEKKVEGIRMISKILKRISEGTGRSGGRLVDGYTLSVNDGDNIYISYHKDDEVIISLDCTNSEFYYRFHVSKSDFDEFVTEYVTARQWGEMSPKARELFEL